IAVSTVLAILNPFAFDDDSLYVYTDNMTENDNSVNMMPPARSYHHGDLREALIDAGLELLKSGNAETLSLREVARRVGVSATAVYRHFPDKAALVRELCVRGALELADAQAKAMVAAGGGQKGFVATGGAYIRFALANPALFRIMMANMPPGGFFSADFSDDQVGIQMLRANLMSLVPETAGEEGVLFSMLMSWAQVHGLAMLMLDGQIPVSEEMIRAFETSRLEFRFVPAQPSE
ncbi:MAG: TetR/AcrR family transcriptional regulator, partial [Chakrabartia godavariana]